MPGSDLRMALKYRYTEGLLPKRTGITYLHSSFVELNSFLLIHSLKNSILLFIEKEDFFKMD